MDGRTDGQSVSQSLQRSREEEGQARRPMCEVKESSEARENFGRAGEGGAEGWQDGSSDGWHMLCLRHSNVSAMLTKSSPT